MKKTYLECGKVLGAHGVRGVLRIESWCDSPMVLVRAKRVFIANKEGEYIERKVLTASRSGGGVIMSIDGVDDRDVAIAMKNTILYLHRDDVPVAKGAMLLADMIGLPVIDADTGVEYGKISDVTEVPRGLLYTISTEKGDVFYPSVDEFIKEIKPDEGMFVTPIPGFFD